MKRFTILALAATLSAATAVAGDWPQIRGPARDGTVDESALADAWGDGGPAVSWRRPIGTGFSGIAVAGGRAFTMAADDGAERVICLDAASGDTIWRRAIGKTFESEFGDGPRSTPLVADGVVYAVSADSQLVALDADDGGERWYLDLTRAFGSDVPRFGYSISPLLDGDALILEVGGGPGRPAVVALDRRNGATLWSALGGGAGYASPIVATLGGERQYVFARRKDAQGGEIVALSTGGEVLWRHPGPRTAIPMPIHVPPDRVFVAASDDGYGGVMLRVDRAADGTLTASEAWHNRRMRNHFNASVAVDGHLYGFDNATFRCLDLETGDQRWAHRGFGKGSLVAAGDRLYVLGDDGTLALVEATPDAYREHGRVQVMEGKSWTAPTLVHGHLYLRDQDEILRLDLRAPGAAP